MSGPDTQLRHLVQMANDIAANISPGKSEADATSAVAAHIRRFWSPGMQSLLVANRETATELCPVARAALDGIIPPTR